MDFLDRVVEYIETRIDMTAFDNSYISIGLLKSPNDIAVVMVPSPSPIKTFGNCRIYTFGFQVYLRHENQRSAIETCQEIELTLDGLTNGAIVSRDDSFRFIKMDATTTTNFVEKTSEGYAYTAIFDAELQI